MQLFEGMASKLHGIDQGLSQHIEVVVPELCWAVSTEALTAAYQLISAAVGHTVDQLGDSHTAGVGMTASGDNLSLVVVDCDIS